MGFVSAAVLGFGSGLGFILSLKFIQRKRSRSRMEKAVAAAMVSRANAEDLKKLIPKELYPSWVQFPEFERVNWLNKELKELWPYLNKAASAEIKFHLENILEQYRPPMIQSLKFQKLTLGNIAPQFGGVRVAEANSEEIVLEIDFKWGGNPSIILSVQTFVGVSLPVQVKDVSLFGVFRVAFSPLVDQIPCFGAITVALREKPVMDFALNIIRGEVTKIPGLSSTIDNLIRTAIMDTLVWPSRHVHGIIPGDYRHLELHPVGRLDVKLVQGRGLLNVEMISKSDPFALLFVRPIPKWMRKSKTIGNSLNPLWNETFFLLVQDPPTQKLYVRVMDFEELQHARFLGEGALPIKDLKPGQLKEVWLPLVGDVEDPQSDSKKRGEVQMEVIYRHLDAEGNPIGSVPPGFPKYVEDPDANPGSKSTRRSTTRQLTPKMLQFDPPQAGVLTVTVKKGKDLVVKDYTGSSDPFVILKMELGKEKYNTKVVQQNLNPEWNESFDLIIQDAAHDLLIMEVWDHDVIGKDFMGRAALTLSRVLAEKCYSAEVRLSEVPTGSLVLSLAWNPLHSSSLPGTTP
eukprot:TRINITY_DN6782_c0_g1_i1.p1 TRINITY_DN6782_c0_g1~~TRINITY_DN6782_c0_g1_i1.p1  ORF type:complete len:573 (+),score=172.20 TRINITY_DN6782_c0_g1_i1:120-1838(+)